ncbi:MAG TPA: SURF1 family protein [Anaerolineales bacterium]|nr:SURF1 family protein [Anaerolineales bacterium]
MLLLKMVQPKWLLATLLVLLGTAFCIRLGIWQLDRLDGRRAFNKQVETMRTLPALNLNQEAFDAIDEMEWRAVTVSGTYDFEHQIAIRNQYHDNQYGYHLLTPLRFNETAVLVDRGWIPADSNSAPADWRKFDETGEVIVTGQLRLGAAKPAFGGVEDVMPENGSRLDVWNNADITRIASQIPYPILPVYIQPNPQVEDVEPPIPFQPQIELTEGPHIGYALQWFTFATILFFGYPFYIRKQEESSP